jgi:hypothetical protein
LESAALFIGLIMWGVGQVFFKEPIAGKKPSFPERKYYSPYIRTSTKAMICF